VKKYEELKAAAFGSDVKSKSANWCRPQPTFPSTAMRGVIWPEARFALKLPGN
jgi:hypothetical protein